MIQINFYKDKGLFPFLIRWFTNSDYNHVDVSFYEGHLRKTISANSKGVKEYTHLKQHQGMYFLFSLHPEVESAIINNLKSQLGKKYDWLAIFSFFFRRNWERQNKWFCSELVLWAFNRAGYQILHTKFLHKITPRDISLSTRATKVIYNVKLR